MSYGIRSWLKMRRRLVHTNDGTSWKYRRKEGFQVERRRSKTSQECVVCSKVNPFRHGSRSRHICIVSRPWLLFISYLLPTRFRRESGLTIFNQAAEGGENRGQRPYLPIVLSSYKAAERFCNLNFPLVCRPFSLKGVLKSLGPRL